MPCDMGIPKMGNYVSLEQVPHDVFMDKCDKCENAPSCWNHEESMPLPNYWTWNCNMMWNKTSLGKVVT